MRNVVYLFIENIIIAGIFKYISHMSLINFNLTFLECLEPTRKFFDNQV